MYWAHNSIALKRATFPALQEAERLMLMALSLEPSLDLDSAKFSATLRRAQTALDRAESDSLAAQLQESELSRDQR